MSLRNMIVLTAIALASCKAASAGPETGDADRKRAAEAALSPAALVDSPATLVVDTRQPMRLADHPIVRSVVESLGRSQELKSRLDSPEFDRVRQAYDLLAEASGEDAAKTIGRLTAGGLAASVVAKPGRPPEVTLALVADDADWLRTTVDSLQKKLLERLPANRRPAALPTETWRGRTLVRAGDAGYLVSGTLFLAANRVEALHRAVDRLEDLSAKGESAKDRPNAPSVGGEREPTNTEHVVLRATLDLEALRADPKFSKGIAMPSDDIGRVAFLGGWTELLRRAPSVTLTLSHDAGGLSLRAAAPVGRTTVNEAVPGFFAAAANARPLPPLRVPETIASASWYRDYASLWTAREKLLTAEARERLDDGDEKAAKQFEVVGGRFLPNELLAGMGPHFRVVVARQQETAYSVELTEKLPAAALTFDVRDGFQAKLEPMLRFVGLIGAADNNRFDSHVEQYRGAKLGGLRTRGDEAQYKTNRIRYQFSPTWGFAHGHFVLGSTTEITRQTIDALEAETTTGAPADAASAPVPEGVTEIQTVSAATAAAALRDFQRALIDSAVLQNGLSPAEATHEVDALTKAVEALGTLTTTTALGENAFEWHLRIGK